ncbi:MAG: non-canonical purine NTP pyrophosphatase [Nannocystaceae bacterium]|nr:non-canonical purine NTP pyrophosphatase [bacterium]
MSGPLRLVVASGNRHKVRELAAMLEAAPTPVAVRGLDAFPDAPSVPETAETFEGNAALKARGIADYLATLAEPGDTVVLADDSGIAVDALGGAPGVYSARFSGEGATDATNNAKLVTSLQSLGRTSSAAHYACVLALCRVDGATIGDEAMLHFEGRWNVEVRVEARGNGGFGYDPHAWIEDGARTVAELGGAEKASRSHRGAAFRALLEAWPWGT